TLFRSKPKMDNVKLVDKGDVKHPDKKNPFCFLPDIKVVSAKGPESKPYTPFPNKDLQNKDSRLEVTFLKETSKWGTFLKLCKDKKEHRAMMEEELMVFRESLPKNVVLDSELSPSSFWHDTKIKDPTSNIIGPCLDLDCSGRNNKGEPVYRIFNSLFEFKKHAGRNSLHSLGVGSILNLQKPDGWSYIKVDNGNNNFIVLKEDTE